MSNRFNLLFICLLGFSLTSCSPPEPASTQNTQTTIRLAPNYFFPCGIDDGVGQQNIVAISYLDTYDGTQVVSNAHVETVSGTNDDDTYTDLNPITVPSSGTFAISVHFRFFNCISCCNGDFACPNFGYGQPEFRQSTATFNGDSPPATYLFYPPLAPTICL